MVGRRVEMAEGGGGYGGDSRTYEMPGVDGMLGRLAAWDIESMRERWSVEQRAMFLTGALTTAGGLVFIGDVDRYFSAFDVRNGYGKHGWRRRRTVTPSATASTGGSTSPCRQASACFGLSPPRSARKSTSRPMARRFTYLRFRSESPRGRD